MVKLKYFVFTEFFSNAIEKHIIYSEKYISFNKNITPVFLE